MFKLIIKSGPLSGQSAEVAAELILGRSGADLNLPDPHISRRHAAVRPGAQGLQIEDLGSSNGTFVNETKIQEPTWLVSGDLIRLGQCSLSVESDEQPSDRTVILAEAAAGHERAEPVEVSAASLPGPPSQTPTVPFSPPTAPRQRGVASRRAGPTIITLAAIVMTAVALVLYFWLR